MKLIDKLFAVSLSLISITSLVVTVTGFAAIPLPSLAGRILALVNLLSLPVLLYSTVMSLKEKLASARALARNGRGAAKALKSGELRAVTGTEAAPKAAAPVKAAQPVKVTPAPRQGSKKKRKKKKK